MTSILGYLIILPENSFEFDSLSMFYFVFHVRTSKKNILALAAQAAKYPYALFI